MFGIGYSEMIIIAIIALLLFGKRLPEVARSLGKGMMEFKKGVYDIQDEVMSATSNRPVTQPLGVVSCEDDLDGTEEPLVKLARLVGEELTDAFADADGTAFELDDAQGEAVHVENQIRPPLVSAAKGHLLGDGEVVGLGPVPVDEPNGLCLLARPRLELHPVAKQAVDGLVVVVKAPSPVVGLTPQKV